MKVLFITDSLSLGGAQRQLYVLGQELVKKGYTVTVLVYAESGFYYDLLVKAGIEVHLHFNKKIIRRIVEARRFIRNHHLDAVISFLGPPNFLNIISAFPARSWRVIVNERSANPAIKRSLKSRLIRHSYLFSDYIVSNSYSNQNLVRAISPFLNKKKFRVIYNGLDLTVFSPDSEYSYRDSGKLRIVVTASYRKLKNLLGLIEAVNRLSDEEKKSLHLDWYGTRNINSHPDNILEAATNLILNYKLNEIIFLNDHIADARAEIRNADAVGLFSFFEGLPNAICEGMACGKPIIASNVSDIPLLVTDKVNGITCDPEDIQSIVSALRFLLNSTPSQLKEMGKLSRQRAEKLFGLQEMVKQYLELIEA